MGFWAGFAIGGLFGGIFGIVVFALLFGTRKEGAAEAGVDHQRRQTDAVIADQERADAKEDAARTADRVSVDDPGVAADVLRQAGRLRKTGN